MSTQPAQARKRTADVVSAEVRAWAARLGMRQRHLAEVLHISQGQVSARLRGQIAWDTDEIDLLAETFGIDPVELQRPPQVTPAAASVGLPRLDSNQQPAGFPSGPTLPPGPGLRRPAVNRAA